MSKIELALAHINSAVDELLELPRWKRWLLGESYDYLLGDCVKMSQFYLEEALAEQESDHD